MARRASLADEGPPETTTIRLPDPRICIAPEYIAEELLRAEGFTDVRYVLDAGPYLDAVSHAARSTSLHFAAWVVSQMDAGEPVTALAGVHPGCYELFAHEPIRPSAT